MAVQKINMEDFIMEAGSSIGSSFLSSIIIDVRSPAEYEHAHIPNALNLPLFDNDERAMIGTTYKNKVERRLLKQGFRFLEIRCCP